MSSIDDNETPHRRRGIRASRLKLMQAKKAAGFKTQAAVAARIADNEGLDSPPKDAVNRAFRELPVEHDTIERIALALGVDSETFLLIETEGSAESTPAPEITRPPTRSGKPWVIAMGVFLLLCLAVVAIYLKPTPSSDEEMAQGFVVNQFKPLNAGGASLSVAPLDFADSAILEEQIREGLAAKFRVASAPASALAFASSQEVETDARLELNIDAVGRYLGLTAFLESEGVRRQIFATSLPGANYPAAQSRLAQQVVRAVLAAIGDSSDKPVLFPLESAQMDYLHGQRHLDAASSELNIRRAQSRFNAALRLDSNYARAHAGLCRALLEEHWLDSEQRTLRDAAVPCTQAMQLAPQDPVVLVAQARYLQVDGQNEAAIELYQEILTAHPRDADALAGLAVSYLHEYQSSGDTSYLEAGRQAAKDASRADPTFWRPYYSLGTIELMANRVDDGVAALEAGLALDENEYLLVNLGTFLTCTGQFEQAKRMYLRARELSPESYIGDEFMGQLHYFLGEFDEARRLRQRAVDSFPNGEPKNHEMWGNLADSLRQTQETDQAIAAYRQAAEIVEEDIMNGKGRASDQAARAYYYAALSALDSELIPAPALEAIFAELDEVAAAQVDGLGFRLMAMTYARLGEIAKARGALRSATTRCKGYTQHPDLRQLGATATP